MMKRWLLCLALLCGAGLSQANTPLTEAQRAEMARVAPGVNLSPELINQLREVVYDRSRSVDERIQAMQRMTGFSLAEPLRRRICIWDIAGRAGPIFSAARDQRLRLLEYGVDIQMDVYTNEGVMVEELKSGRCDAALMTGLRARLFNTFTGTIDSVGGLPTDEHMRTLLEVLTDPRMADRMHSNEYIVLGIAPGGAAYVFVNDRSVNTLAKAAGKRVPVLDYDPTQARMVAQIGATPVASDIVSAPTKFNNGSVDVLPAPLVAYEVLELYKGLGRNGGIIEYPLAQITMQLVGRASQFPPEVAQLVREAFFEGYDEIMARLQEEANKVPAHWWVSIPEQDKQEYETMMQDARIQLRDEGYYSPEMLTLQRRIRCKLEASRSECTNPVE